MVLSMSEVTAAEIARIAGVGRAAVSNWRRRYPDFPRPVGGSSASPTFDLDDVRDWLSANGRPSDRFDRGQPQRSLAAAALLTAAAAVLPRLSQGTVVDPACGDGSALAAVAERLGPSLRYVGRDEEEANVETARAALAEAGASSVEVSVASPVAVPTPDAEMVVSLAPVRDRPVEGPAWDNGQTARADQPLAWAQIYLSHLKPGGTGVLVVPFAMAVRASARRVRVELLRTGMLTHVIGLPDNAAAAPAQIWILKRPAGRPSYVLRLVDLTELPRGEEGWAAVFSDPARTRDVPAIELLDEDVFLVPAAHIAVEARDVRPEYAAQGERYAAAVRRLADTVPRMPAEGSASGFSLVTVADLARSGALKFVDRTFARPGDVVVPAHQGSFEAFVLDGAADLQGGPGQVLRCDREALDPHFVACFLRSEINRRSAGGALGGTFRLDLRRARVPRLPLTDQRRYGDAFRRLTRFASAADEVAATAAAASRTAIYGLTSGIFAPEKSESEF